MKLSTAKDKVLKALVKGGKSFDQLEIPTHTKNAALVDLGNEGYISVIETTTLGSGHIKSYMCKVVHPIGAHFVQSKQSFRRIAFWKWVEDFPKKYWFIVALVASMGLNVISLIKYCLR